MDYLVKIRSVQTPLNGQFSIGANTLTIESPFLHLWEWDYLLNVSF